MMKINGLNPKKKVTWTMWNLDDNGQIESWLGTSSKHSTEEVFDLGASDDIAAYYEVPGNTPLLDKYWDGKTFVGIAITNAKSGKPYLFYTPSCRASIKE